jgi:hypothetical protein
MTIGPWGEGGDPCNRWDFLLIAAGGYLIDVLRQCGVYHDSQSGFLVVTKENFLYN